jgi:hypothetical protein
MPIIRRSEFRKYFDPLTAKFECYRPDFRSVNIPNRVYFGSDDSTFLIKHGATSFSLDLDSAPILKWITPGIELSFDPGAPAPCTMVGPLEFDGSLMIDIAEESNYGAAWASFFSVAVDHGHELYPAINDDTNTIRIWTNPALVPSVWAYLELL